VGAKIITTDPLDQGIEVVYVNPTTNKLHLNSPLNSTSLANITIIPDRKTPLIGLKCRDFIQSSTGRNVRNRTQVYPTRLSTGSTGVIKVDLLKTPIFQTTSAVTGITTISADVNIGKSGSPTIVTLTNTGYLSTSTGTYGYFRGYLQNDSSQRKISVLGYLEKRVTNEYYFNALNSTSDNIILTTIDPFLREENHDPVGNIVSSTTSETTLAQLSSVKVSPQIRSPIPTLETLVPLGIDVPEIKSPTLILGFVVVIPTLLVLPEEYVAVVEAIEILLKFVELWDFVLKTTEVDFSIVTPDKT